MRWQRGLRWLIAVAGVSFAVFLYLRFDRKPPVAPAPVPEALPKDASYQSNMGPGGRQCRFDGPKEISCVSYARFTQFKDGRRVIEKPVFEGDRGGKPFLVSADSGELRAGSPDAGPNDIPAETHLIGHVVMREQDGMEIKTEDATYNDSTGTLVVPGALTFARDRLAGSGVGASYVRGEQLLRINDQAAIKIAPDQKGQGKLDGQSRTMELNRALHSLILNGNAVIVRDEETIRTDLSSMHLTDDEQGIAVMQMRGHSGIVPLVAASKTPEMHADDIDLEFHPDGRTISRSVLTRTATLSLASGQGRQQISADRLDVQLAPDGHTVKQLTGTSTGPASLVQVTLPQTADAPRRVIKARTLNSSGNEKDGLTSATFQDAVDFVETRTAARGQAPADRRIRSRSLALSLNGGDLSNIKDARFREPGREQVRFENGTTTGRADDVTYLAAEGKLILRPIAAASRAEVDAAKINVKAKNIDITLEKTGIEANGEVRTETKPDKDSKAGGLFDETKTVNGRAARLTYDEAKHTATYDEGAWLRQGTTRIEADKLTIDDTAGDLSADGKVVTYLPMDNVAGTGNEPPKATAAKLRYVDSAHRAIYSGTAKEPAQFAGPDGIVRAVTIDLTLSAEGRELVKMIADGSVVSRVSADQTARGDHMEYDVKAGSYVLDGKLARLIVKKTENSADTCTQTMGVRITFTKAGEGREKDFVIGTPGSQPQTIMLQTCQDWVIK